MRPDILIVGQGLAGTWLGREFERAGIPFAITEAGAEVSNASRVAAGIINPITGRRLVKSWRIDLLLPAARAAYEELESAWGVSVWREMRVRRIFRDAREREVHALKAARGELAPFAGASDDEGFWIEGAARVDVRALLDAAARRWRKDGRAVPGPVEWERESGRYGLVIDCRGLAGARDPRWSAVPWEFSKGEIVELNLAVEQPDVIVNRGHWLLPVAPGVAWVGATHEPGKTDSVITEAARAVLETSAATLAGDRRPVAVAGQFAGVRVNLPDKRPVAGRHATAPGLGIVNGLGAKGASLAPMLARQWVNHLTEGVPFDAEVNLARFSERKTGT